MKKYYLVEQKNSNGNLSIFVSDVCAGLEILKEIEANSYSEAVRRYSFSARNMGKTAYCGVDVKGNPFHGEA